MKKHDCSMRKLRRRCFPNRKCVDDGEGFCENCSRESFDWQLLRWRLNGGEKPTETRCVPPYSADIAAAMSVVEKMREWGWKVSLMGEPDDDWWVVFSQGDDDPMAQSFLPSLPEAICHAAVKATEDAAALSAISSVGE